MFPLAVMCEFTVKSPSICNDDDKSFPETEEKPIPILSLFASLNNIYGLLSDSTLKSLAPEPSSLTVNLPTFNKSPTVKSSPIVTSPPNV